ncbi:MAG TPA: tRNA (guanosine(37)-N1)-methyltransferase TrmD [Myxococcota bacterium]|nr:tRNA (guanosine(37)-N1)-methyltransferase TrmD [Myxococcota bacterium]
MSKLEATFITMAKEPLTTWLLNSIMGRAEKSGFLCTHVEAILESVLSHHQVDDTPYGGGPGELMKIDVVAPLINKALLRNPARDRKKKRLLLMDPAGTVFNQSHAQRLIAYEELIFVSGRYEGIDARVYHYIDEAISLGDFVLSSGDLAAMAIFDATARLKEGVLGNKDSVLDESHINGRLESSHYTRPADYEGHVVPSVLMSGNHALIKKARAYESLLKTGRLRPDLFAKHPLSPDEIELSESIEAEDLTYPWQKNS